MKKISFLIKSAAVILLALSCAFVAACVQYKAPSAGDGTGGGGEGGGDKKFTVTLVCEGEPFTPPIDMEAKWTGEDGIYSAKFDENGKAEAEGPDGDYHVTLSAVPEGYTYDPNGYFADNRNRDTEIEMLKIIPTSGRGDGPYRPIVVRKPGTYRATLSGKGVCLNERALSYENVIFYEYEPQQQGRYSIESWVDTAENEINPIIDVLNGSSQFKIYSHRQDDGGYSSTYTKNFRLALELSSDMVGNVWTFVLYADCKSGKYPVTVDFTIKFEGDFVADEREYKPVPTSGPYWDGSRPAGTERWVYADTNRVLDGSRVKLYKWVDANGNGIKDDGEGDDFYHLYDQASDTYGALLFAKINRDSEVLVTEQMGQIIDRGFMWNERYGGLINLTFDGKSYLDLVDAYNLYCNSDGGHPVTEELKEFLQAYAVYQRFFFDGNGWAEDPDGRGRLKSSEENQWMFGCYYYAT